MSILLFPFNIWHCVYQPSFSNWYSIRQMKPYSNFRHFSSPASSSLSRFCSIATVTKHHNGMPEGFTDKEWNFFLLWKQRISGYPKRIIVNQTYKIKFPEILLSVRSQWPHGLKVWVSSRSLPGIVDSNSAGGMDVCLLWGLNIVSKRSLGRADPSFRGILPNVVCLSVMVKPRQ